MKRLDWLVTRPIAHRGLFDADRPENSLAAFRKAALRGIPFELDVQLARDGLLVVEHDADLARLTGEKIETPDVDHSQLRRLRIGSSGAGCDAGHSAWCLCRRASRLRSRL